MNANNLTTAYYDLKQSDGDIFYDESFESALYEMYNDVLSYAIIPEDEEFHVSYLEDNDDIKDETLTVSTKRERFLTGISESNISQQSPAPSIDSSFMLSVGEIQTVTDDDLSYMTDFGVEESRLMVKVENIEGRVTPILCFDEQEAAIECFEEKQVPIKCWYSMVGGLWIWKKISRWMTEVIFKGLRVKIMYISKEIY